MPVGKVLTVVMLEAVMSTEAAATGLVTINKGTSLIVKIKVATLSHPAALFVSKV